MRSRKLSATKGANWAQSSRAGRPRAELVQASRAATGILCLNEEVWRSEQTRALGNGDQFRSGAIRPGWPLLNLTPMQPR